MSKDHIEHGIPKSSVGTINFKVHFEDKYESRRDSKTLHE